MTAFYLTQNPQAIEYLGKPIALFGIVTDDHDPKVGKVWLLGTDAFTRQRSWIVRNSHRVLEEVSEPYQVLWNFIDARQHSHIRWLKWLGFTIKPSTNPLVLILQKELTHV